VELRKVKEILRWIARNLLGIRTKYLSYMSLERDRYSTLIVLVVRTEFLSNT
jgi:hypothetical protein